jgi:branched-chain amino acid transport system ATP-binding protein
MQLLQIKGLDKYFGGLHVTREISFSLSAGERLALIGPNGAGKTTLVNLISGVLKPSKGAVVLHDADITQLSQPHRVREGLVRTFQLTTLPIHIPVLLQVEMALHQRYGLAGSMWRQVNHLDDLRNEALVILRDLNLSNAVARTPAELSYGEQRMVEMALALALKPKVLLLDEPMAGVPKADGRSMLEAIKKLPPELAVLIIEHDMDLVFNFASRIIVLAEGAVLAEGTPDEIRQHPKVREVYLGSKA